MMRLFLVVWAASLAAGCAPPWRTLEERAWAPYLAPSGGFHCELPNGSAPRDQFDMTGTDHGHAVHVVGVSRQIDDTLNIGVLAYRYDTPLPLVDAAFLRAARTSWGQPDRNGVRVTVLSFRPATTDGLPGYDVEIQSGSALLGYVRLFCRIAIGQRTEYLMMTYDTTRQRAWDPHVRTIQARLVNSFRSDGDRPPAALPAAAEAFFPSIELPAIRIGASSAPQPGR